MSQSTDIAPSVKNVAEPDERRAMALGVHEEVNLPGATVNRATYQPGWRWSASVKPLVGTDSCQATHTGYVISGRFHVRMDDGREFEMGPGDAHVIGAGHDAWVAGKEPCTILDVALTGVPLGGHVVRCPCGVEFRVPTDDQLDHLVAALQQHAAGSHGHELSREQVLAEVTSA